MIAVQSDRASRLAALFLVVLWLAGCASTGPRVVAEHNPDVDFGQFRTFSFAEPLATDRQGRRTTLSAQLMAATTRELQARGLQPVSNSPDLVIDFFVAEQTGAASSNMSVASSPFVHAHGGITTWSGYDLRNSTTRRITAGTLIIDVVDARRGALVFEGLLEDRITEAMRDNLTETVSNSVSEILAHMP
mgnify:FL=1